ncbi:hypothetical protein HDU76_008518 [Blyttiomyces sp. JEL0837]|nr:hypothetical protein HDU76_008518 [Blyttiomyces sp. JEL0837]
MQQFLILSALTLFAGLTSTTVLADTCGDAQYDPTVYTCTNGLLCPFGELPCGVAPSYACYNPAIYGCVNGNLTPAPVTSSSSSSSSAVVATSTMLTSSTDDFDYLDTKTWSHDVTLRGGGNWEFEWYTNNRSNSYVKDSVLYLRPTFTADNIGY